MLILPEDQYYQVIEPLSHVEINHFFARSVVEKCISGEVYVDSYQNPETFYVVHPYGMGLLFGKCNNHVFNQSFFKYALNTSRQRTKMVWVQVWPNIWIPVIEELSGDKLKSTDQNSGLPENEMIIQDIRVNFRFNRSQYLKIPKPVLDETYELVRTNIDLFHSITGTVIPRNFWSSANEFVQHGVGFSCVIGDKLASTAYSAFIHDHFLEIGIETVPEFQGKGIARLVCSALIDFCLENSYEPVWACRKGNTSSYLLAQKLGFEPVCEIPYYRLPV